MVLSEVQVDFINDGSQDATTYLFAINATKEEDLITMEVMQDGEKIEYVRAKAYDNPMRDVIAYKAILGTPVKPDTQGTIHIGELYTG